MHRTVKKKGTTRPDRQDGRQAKDEGNKAGLQPRQAAANREAVFRQTVEQANKGDRAALARLSAFLDQNPVIWERAGDLNGMAERAWAELIAAGNQLVAES